MGICFLLPAGTPISKDVIRQSINQSLNKSIVLPFSSTSPKPKDVALSIWISHPHTSRIWPLFPTSSIRFISLSVLTWVNILSPVWYQLELNRYARMETTWLNLFWRQPGSPLSYGSSNMGNISSSGGWELGMCGVVRGMGTT